MLSQTFFIYSVYNGEIVDRLHTYFSRGVFLIFTFANLSCSESKAQELSFIPDFSLWDKETLIQARNASFKKSNPDTSGAVIFYCNLARMNGPLFVQAILRPYMEFMGKTDYEPYLQSLVVDLNSLKKLHPLQRCEVLDSMAKSYAKWSGRHWIIGHVKFIERFGVLIEDGKLVGENCSYGISSAIGVVMQLLVDEGVRSLGHRENILDPAFNKIGVGFAPHGRYKTNCVLEFSD